MAVSRITRQEARQMPDDGRRRFTHPLPVRTGEATVGEIELEDTVGQT